MKNKFFLLLVFAAIFIAACNNTPQNKKQDDNALIEGHPAWINQGNIYEVNIRQYTPEGTFNAFAKHLERLKEMGVQTLWFMPINPIGVKDRKGAMGSYYAVKSYVQTNPEFGTMDDWKNLVKKAHDLGFKVIIDWVPNHTAADHEWLTTHKDFYVLDSVTKQPLSPFDWTDVRKLNYSNKALRDSMISQMKFWITESDIDGFRCDVAGEVPDDFWKTCIADLRKIKNIFMLAEGDKKELHEDGFDATYAWFDFAMMNKIANGSRTIKSLDSATKKTDSLFPKNALRMFFTSNHDENSWNKADYATMPGVVHAPFAVLSQTIKNTIPLIYSGQEEPVLDSISFFYKNPIQFGKYQRANFYKTLLNLRKRNEAFAMDASFKKLSVGNDEAVYAFVREKGKSKVLVVLNLSAKEQDVNIKEATALGKAKNVFTGKDEEIKSENKKMQPWGYWVFEF